MFLITTTRVHVIILCTSLRFFHRYTVLNRLINNQITTKRYLQNINEIKFYYEKYLNIYSIHFIVSSLYLALQTG